MKKFKRKTRSQVKPFEIVVLDFLKIAEEIKKECNLSAYQTPVVYDSEEFDSFYNLIEYKVHEFGSVLDFKYFNPNLGNVTFKDILYEFLKYGDTFLIQR